MHLFRYYCKHINANVLCTSGLVKVSMCSHVRVPDPTSVGTPRPRLFFCDPRCPAPATARCACGATCRTTATRRCSLPLLLLRFPAAWCNGCFAARHERRTMPHEHSASRALDRAQQDPVPRMSGCPVVSSCMGEGLVSCRDLVYGLVSCVSSQPCVWLTHAATGARRDEPRQAHHPLREQGLPRARWLHLGVPARTKRLLLCATGHCHVIYRGCKGTEEHPAGPRLHGETGKAWKRLFDFTTTESYSALARNRHRTRRVLEYPGPNKRWFPLAVAVT